MSNLTQTLKGVGDLAGLQGYLFSLLYPAVGICQHHVGISLLVGKQIRGDDPLRWRAGRWAIIGVYRGKSTDSTYPVPRLEVRDNDSTQSTLPAIHQHTTCNCHFATIGAKMTV